MPKSSCPDPRRGARLVLAVVLALASVSAFPAESTCGLDGVARVVAVGDVHGAYDNFIAVLKMAGLVDERLHWSGGAAHLVQVGDTVDRGPDSRKVLDLLMRLEDEARRAGGRVHALLGNHEVMNMLGDMRYVTPGEYEAFRGPDSEQLRNRYYRLAASEARDRARREGTAFDESVFREQFFKETPLGFVEKRQAFGADGTYGRWLRGHDTVVKIDGVVFLHGGLTPEVAKLGCRAINEAVRRELTSDIARTRAQPLASLAAREAGPLWYRGLAKEDEAVLAPAVDEILKAMQARAIVVAHTVTGDGRIHSRFGGRVLTIDVGMVESYGGHRAALEITPDGFRALYPTGPEPLTPSPSPSAAPPSLPTRSSSHPPPP
ncbi:MAG TPA: metallophosphoesterase [Vicinamibacteria bacterium]|nr:metallophosphoesterase [Vicinamibacteria bacterium]